MARIEWAAEDELTTAGQVSGGELSEPLIIGQVGSPEQLHPLIADHLGQIRSSGQSEHVSSDQSAQGSEGSSAFDHRLDDGGCQTS